MRCSACFAECFKVESIACVVCNLWFHLQCTSWPSIDFTIVRRLKGNWHCIFCRTNQIKDILFQVENTSCGIRQTMMVRKSAKLSVKNFERKVMSFKKTIYNSSFILDDMFKSLGQLRQAVGVLSAYNLQVANENVKFQKAVGDMSNQMENLRFL